MDKPPFHFGYGSLKQRDTLHPDLKKVLDEASKTFNFTILCGYRNEEDQNKAYKEGNSKVKWPDSRHNTYPSEAVDCVPYDKTGVPWKDVYRFARMMGHIEAAAIRVGVQIELGMDWDMDGDTVEHSFKDFPHVQLKRPVSVL